jgi:hypothetical protein
VGVAAGTRSLIARSYRARVCVVAPSLVPAAPREGGAGELAHSRDARAMANVDWEYNCFVSEREAGSFFRPARFSVMCAGSCGTLPTEDAGPEGRLGRRR